MATESIDYVSPETKTKIEDQVLFRPGQHASGIVDWLPTIDHKKSINGLSALFFLIIGVHKPY